METLYCTVLVQVAMAVRQLLCCLLQKLKNIIPSHKLSISDLLYNRKKLSSTFLFKYKLDTTHSKFSIFGQQHNRTPFRSVRLYRIPEVGGAFVPQTFRSSSSKFGLPLLLASAFESASDYAPSEYWLLTLGLRHSSEVSKAPSHSPLIWTWTKKWETRRTFWCVSSWQLQYSY